MPNIIAYAQLVTTDLPLASFLFVTFYYLWKFFKTGFNKQLIYSGLFLYFVLSSKFSAVLFLPVVLFLIFVYVKSRQSDPNLIINRFAKISAVMAVLVFLVVYFFLPYVGRLGGFI